MENTFTKIPDKWLLHGFDLNTAFVLQVIKHYQDHDKEYFMSNKSFIEKYPIFSEKTLRRRIEVLKHIGIITEIRRHGNNVAKLCVDESNLEFFLDTDTKTIREHEISMRCVVKDEKTMDMVSDTMDTVSNTMDNLSTDLGHSVRHNGHHVQTHIPDKLIDKENRKINKKVNKAQSNSFEFNKPPERDLDPMILEMEKELNDIIN